MEIFGTGVGRICAVVAASTAKQAARQLQEALRETPTVELRLDWLRSDAERSDFLAWLKRSRVAQKATLLATCRRREGGGEFRSSVGRELAWLERAHDAGCQWCDLEVETLRTLPTKSIRAYGLGKILSSVHHFDRTPDLPRSFRPHGGADAVKIAANAQSIGDSVRMLQLARKSQNFVGVPMGEVGLPARLLSLRDGSALSYAPVAEATAPGQVSLQDLKYLYRAHEVTRHTRVYGVIADPVAHSLSPLMHNTGFAARRCDAVYLPILVRDLKDFLGVIPDFGIRGFSVTLPHKQTILRHLDTCEPLAAQIGAVNTVVVGRGGSLHGYNTDYIGVLRALQPKLRLQGSRALVFGAGGSARAVAFALACAGAEVAICARRPAAAADLARASGGEVVSRSALRTQSFDVVVNTTPLGMHPHDGASPLAARELNCRVVMDLIYNPQRTKLLKLAAQRGIATVSGVEMFLAQGFAQWEIWFGKRAPERAMRRAVLEALRKNAAARSNRSRA